METFTIHPLYSGSETLRNDVAIIHTTEAFDIAQNVNTICLPKFDGHFSDLTCSSMGWGVNSEDVDINTGNHVNIMKQVKLNRVTDREKCLADIQATDKVSNTWELDNSWICAKKASDEVNDEDINLCQGDGGGPLVCKEKGTDRYYSDHKLSNSVPPHSDRDGGMMLE